MGRSSEMAFLCMKTNENNPQDWFRAGEIRLRSADHLVEVEGVTESVIELLQEAVERYLKGFLILNGWKLRKIHDLSALMAEAIIYDARFTVFEDFADSLTDQFWAQHYPGGDLTGLGQNYTDMRNQVTFLLNLIQEKSKAHSDLSP